MLKKNIISLFICVLFPCTHYAHIKPFSQITINSKKMTGSPIHDTKDYAIAYTDDVTVTLADQSVITADKLEVIVQSNNTAKKGTVKTKSPYKEIKLNGNICIKRKEHTILADAAEFIIEKQTCKVTGNVKITQAAKQTDQNALEINSNQALVDLTSEKLILLGSHINPVTTTLMINDTSTLKKKKLC